MKKFIALVAIVSFVFIASCAGTKVESEKGTYVQQAKAIAIAAAYSTIGAGSMSMLAVAQDYSTNYCTDASGTGKTFSYSYDDIISSAGSSIMTGSYNFVSSTCNSVTKALSVTVPNGTVSTEHDLNELVIPSFTIAGTTYGSITMDTSTDNDMMMYNYGTIAGTYGSGGSIESATVTGSGIEVTSATVYLDADRTDSGTVTLSGYEYPCTTDGTQFQCILGSESSTVVYSGETYNCTGVAITYTSDLEEEEDGTISVINVSCTCPTCS